MPLVVELWKAPCCAATSKLLHDISPSLNTGINIYLGSLWILVLFFGMVKEVVYNHSSSCLMCTGSSLSIWFITSVELINFVTRRSVVFFRRITSKQHQSVKTKHNSLKNVRNVSWCSASEKLPVSLLLIPPLCTAPFCLQVILTRGRRFIAAFPRLFAALLGLHFRFSSLFHLQLTVLRKETRLVLFRVGSPSKQVLYFL